MPTYRNLVFKGGGVRGIAYIGALKYLYENGLMRSVERCAGTSAGAITATVVALNCGSFEALKAISDSLDYRKVPAEGGGNLQCSLRLIQEKGWYTSDYFYSWIKAVIASQFTVKKDSYSFRDFGDPSLHEGHRPFFDLFITGTDISNRKARVFSLESTPDMEVALAVRISMSIPLFFESVPFRYPGMAEPSFFADGGLMWNYPVSIFDDPKYGKKFSQGMNAETLGFFLYTSPESTEYKEVKGLIDYLGALFESLLLVQEQLVLYGEKNKERTIFIDDKGVSQTSFGIVSGDEVYEKLFDSGYTASKGFFAEKRNWDMLLHQLQARFGWKKTEY